MDHLTIVLFSGGWESTYCLIKAIKSEPGPVIPVYFDYGQVFYSDEMYAANTVAQYFNQKLVILAVPELREAERGVVPGRNTSFLLKAVQTFQPVRGIYLGSRGIFQWMDRYGDSNLSYARTMSKALGVRIKTPCTLLPKRYIKHQVRKAGVSDTFIFSTES